MTKKALIAIPYRDSYFINQYGFAVRDTQIIYELQKMDIFSKIIVINRPVSIYERFLTKKKKSLWPSTDTFDITSYDVLGPLSKRVWTVNCYENYFKDVLQNLLDKNKYEEIVILDFTPMSLLPILKSSVTKLTYWYDMIDNFTKHNRYDEREKNLVKEKYTYVREEYDVVTGVSNEALDAIGHNDAHLLTNGVFKHFDKTEVHTSKVYDFGFIGFVTDKFDIQYIKKLAFLGYSIIVHGEIMDKSIQRQLEESGILCTGSFSYIDISTLMATFKIGLLPYLHAKSHDGSPLKLYEYLKFNKPCLTSMNYEVQNKFVVNYNQENISKVEIEKLMLLSSSSEISQSILKSDYLSYKINSILPNIIQLD